MDVELLYISECPSAGLARDRVAEAARRLGIDAVVRERVVADESEAAALGMTGSPTVLVAGADVSGGVEDGAPSLSCRLYLGDRGVEGAPTVDQIAAALTRAVDEPGSQRQRP